MARVSCFIVVGKMNKKKVIMKKVLVTLVLVMTLGVSVSFAQGLQVEVPVVEKPQQSKVGFLQIYMNDVCRKP